MHLFSATHQKALDAVGEIARDRVGIAAVEAGDKDSVADGSEQLIQCFAASDGQHFYTRGIFHCGRHSHLGCNVSI